MADRVPTLSEAPHALEALAQVRVLYTDLDGTLVAKGGCVLADADGAPSTLVAEAIVDVNRAHLDVVPISGRSRLQLRELTQLLGWDAYIAEAGAIIVHGTGLGAEVRFDRGTWTGADADDGETPFEIITRAGAYEALVAAFPGRIEHYAPWQLEREATLLLRGCLDVAEAQSALDPLDVPVDLVDNGMVRSYGSLECRDVVPHAYHVVPRGVSKARAISLDLASRGLSREHAAAIGDSAADLGMADAVGVMALVANAFDSHGVLGELKRNPRDNVVRTTHERGAGWAEFARVWLAATAGPKAPDLG